MVQTYQRKVKWLPVPMDKTMKQRARTLEVPLYKLLLYRKAQVTGRSVSEMRHRHIGHESPEVLLSCGRRPADQVRDCPLP
jgi:hypothetical protein